MKVQGSQLMGLGCGQRDLDQRQALCWAACGAGQVWQASGIKPPPGSCLLPVFLGGFAASVCFGLFPFASGFFSPRELTVLDVCCLEDKEKGKTRGMVCFSGRHLLRA